MIFVRFIAFSIWKKLPNRLPLHSVKIKQGQGLKPVNPDKITKLAQ